MASVRSRLDSGLLFFDFRYKGVRCREQTTLVDNKPNRTKMEKILKKIEEDIEADRFEYRRYFPNSKLAVKFDSPPAFRSKISLATQQAFMTAPTAIDTPLFSEFVEQWYGEFSVGWRRTYKSTVQQIITSRLIPTFGDQAVSNIRREDILSFRSTDRKSVV